MWAGATGGRSWWQGGDLHPQSPTRLRSEEWCPPPKLKAPWVENLQGKLTKLFSGQDTWQALGNVHERTFLSAPWCGSFSQSANTYGI